MPQRRQSTTVSPSVPTTDAHDATSGPIPSFSCPQMQIVQRNSYTHVQHVLKNPGHPNRSSSFVSPFPHALRSCKYYLPFPARRWHICPLNIERLIDDRKVVADHRQGTRGPRGQWPTKHVQIPRVCRATWRDRTARTEHETSRSHLAISATRHFRVRDELEHIWTAISGSSSTKVVLLGSPTGIVQDALALMKDAGLDPFRLPRNPRSQ